MKKTAIILFNLGGPDIQESVRPFLFNLFNDAAIISLPNPLRFLIAKLISSRRAPTARHIYAQMGGGSPILKNTQAQAAALETLLNLPSPDPHPQSLVYKTFIAMRYWHPFADQTAAEVKQYAPDQIILLPLYPQFSTTTTASSFKDWRRAARKYGIVAPTKSVCCYPQQNGFIAALAASTRAAYAEAQKYGQPRILFSAHGLPEKIIRGGDPYQAQCEMTVEALRRALAIENLDSVLCYQSRVGPLQWIKPATDDQVRRAAMDKIPLVVVPIAFVSDHSETLVEIDIEYRQLAMQNGAPFYACVPAVGVAADFINGLAQIVHGAERQNSACLPDTGARLCPADKICPCST